MLMLLSAECAWTSTMRLNTLLGDKRAILSTATLCIGDATAELTTVWSVSRMRFLAASRLSMP
jgi:hypothetical protein